MTSPLDLAGQVVDLVRQVAGPGAQAEVGTERADLALTRFANSFIHQNMGEAATSVRLRVHLDGRTASGSSTVVTSAGLRDLVERTVAAARHCPPDPSWPGLAPPAEPDGTGNWDDFTASATADQRAERVREFVEAAGGLETAGYCRTGRREGAFANSAGHTVTGRNTEAAMDGIARCGGADGVARLSSFRLGDLLGGVLGGRASVKARAGVAPVELAPGRYEVVLESTAVADLLQNLATYGFNGKAYNEQRSFAVPGTAQFDRSVTLVDDALAGPALPFDAEGTPRVPVALVERGVTTAVAHDRRTAAEAGAGAASTGHAVPGGAATGAVPLHLRLEPAPSHNGLTRASEVSGPVVDSDTAALVAEVRRGLLVTDLWYTRVLDPRSLVVTGLTRNGVWLIEDGEVAAAVQNFRFTQSYPQALAPGAVLGVGRHTALQSQTFSSAWWSAPPLRLASWNFTGGASG
ncbi:TldD/PmbA family protein [Plantactinospora sp. S1510]|uniref:TldD/PmbA family protein n=1 Tax=Plantactinospora alkalitolerans TaxID=2789879 RepID=A0ABS0GS58_9ACTN|nr:metallopeptidase TldD-related protein [Plantactinospora alkalitolerans]MBF9129034.1 TldD/PmbA family protein [Plantactinospora alkalitolerans]